MLHEVPFRRIDAGKRAAFDTKDYADIDDGQAATFHKSQVLTVDQAHVVATPGMDRHSAHVGLSRHRDALQIHYGHEDFADQRQLVHTPDTHREWRKGWASETAGSKI